MVYLCLTKCKALEDSKETDFGQHPVEFALKSGKSCLMWHFLVFIIIIPYFFFRSLSLLSWQREQAQDLKEMPTDTTVNNNNKNNNGIIKKPENKIK